MDISLDLYKIFCTVVRAKNMSEAAKQLYISQPAVSMSVKQLEDRLGSQLLVRTAKGVRVTPEGGVLYEYLEQALSLIKTAEKKYFEMVNLQSGEVRIGASDTVLSNYLMPYLEKYNSLYPDITIKVTNKTTYESIKLLKSGAVDFCFVNLPIDDVSNLEFAVCLKINECFVGGEKFKNLSEKGIEFKNISMYPLLLLEDLSNSRRCLNKFASLNGVILKPIIELGSYDLLLDFARINLGITCIIKEFTKYDLENKILYEIPTIPPLPERYIAIAKLKNVVLSNAAKSFAGLFDVKFL